MNKTIAALTLSGVLIATSASALVTTVSDPVEQNRFQSGANFPITMTPNTSGDFLMDGYDLSGLGWSTSFSQRNFAMVSPRHFIGATHFQPPTGSTVSFRTSSGAIETYTVSSVEVMPNSDASDSDLFVGTLSEDVSSGITHYGVADLGMTANYTGRDLLVYGRGDPNSDGPKVGTGTIESFQYSTGISDLNDTETYRFNYIPSTAGDNEAYFQENDSGSPSFIIENGQLAITGTHSFYETIQAGPVVTARRNYDTFTAEYIDDMNIVMADEGYSITAVPEPRIAAAFLAFAAVGFGLLRRRVSR